MSGLVLPDNYDSGIRPNNVGSADVISVSMQMLALRAVDERENSFTLDFMLRTSWKDPRLARLVKMPTQFVNNLPNVWLPDLHVMNSMATTSPEISTRGLTLDDEGAVIHSER